MSLTYRTTLPPPQKKKIIIINKVHQLCRLWNSGFPPTKRTTRENSVGRLSYSTREEAPKSPSFDYNRSKSSLEHRHRHRPKILLLKKCNLAPNIEPWRQASRTQKIKQKIWTWRCCPNLVLWIFSFFNMVALSLATDYGKPLLLA